LASCIDPATIDTSIACCAQRGPGRGGGDRSDEVRSLTEVRNRGGSLDWATAWLRMTPHRLVSFAEVAWQGVADTS
jgi:hypothetical protein